MEQKIMSTQGFNKLKSELENLLINRRPAVIERLRAARALGDLSENSEYDDARSEQSFVEGRIEELKETIKHAKIVDKTSHGNTVDLGSKVFCTVEGDKEEYELVSSIEADPSNGKISIDSPLGKSLFGKRKGDTAVVKAPAGDIAYKINSIS